MADTRLNVVTGAFGFTGGAIARRLLDRGERVMTLTGHPDRESDLTGRVSVAPLDFDNPGGLAESMSGAEVVYNTYWIRFAHGDQTFDRAVRNTLSLIRAAREAGVRRFVHVSITNPSHESPLPYFSGKVEIEQAITESGLSYAILRPAVIFGDQGILINNIAWFLRRFPVFPIPGDGKYGLQPILVDDLADLAVSMASTDDNIVTDAVGPETYTFNELLRLIADTIGSRTTFVHVPPRLAQVLSNLPGCFVGDVVLTRDEVTGLMDNLLVSSQTPTGNIRLSDWLAANSDWLGREYMSELKKHY